MEADLEARERAKYEKVWSLPQYRVANQALQLWQRHRGIFPVHPRHALDIGCGNGRLFQQWNAEGIDGHGVDFAPNALDKDHPNADKFTLQCLWADALIFGRPGMFDLGVCADVMEHIPPERVDDVIRNAATHCALVIFQIANYPSRFGDLHLTLRNAEWWLAKLSEFGEVEQLPCAREGVNEYVFRFKPR
jgi:2-polyprenyl-3-methyl-5-hydroxy-6-metoxy-1,4-benzoquinol methylase